MIKSYFILVMAALIWKGCFAWKRGRRTYQRDRQEHDSLREYLLGNGATKHQSLQPFYRHAVQRALQPLIKQWRLWLILVILGAFVFWFG